MNGSPAFDMKNILLYFTGTGNSLAVARYLAAKLPDTEIFSAVEVLRNARFNVDCASFGIVFPVCCQDIPEMVKRLVGNLKLPADAYVYAVATHNGDVGFSHFTLDRILKKNGRRLHAGFAVLMPGNSITTGNSTNSDQETDRRVKAAEACVSEIALRILSRETPPYCGSASLRKHLKGMRNMFRHRILYRVPNRFWTTDQCNLCGLCARICPENNITVSDAVRWGKRCQMCLACIHWCPNRAIQNGKGTMNQKRYHHPDIRIEDLMHRE